jgi:hypothetical protein
MDTCFSDAFERIFDDHAFARILPELMATFLQGRSEEQDLG